MYNNSIGNQSTAGVGPITCIPTHLSNSFWSSPDFTWDGSVWTRFSLPSATTVVLGPPINGWNTNDNRPTDINLTLLFDNLSGVTTPVTVTITIKDSAGITLGTTNVVYSEVGSYGATASLNWAGSNPASGFGNVEFLADEDSFGPIITCLELVGANASRNITIDIDSSTNNLNLKTLFELSNDPAVGGDIVTFNITDDSVFIGSSDATLPSIDTDVWSGGVTINLVNNSLNVTGAGGDGTGPNQGQQGGTALLAQSFINLTYTDGSFRGGGGGGAGTDQHLGAPSAGSQTYQAGGGGGGGSVPGSGEVVTGNQNNSSGVNGSALLGGAGGNFGSDQNQPIVIPGPLRGGTGGNIGQPGQNAGDVGEVGSEDNIGGLAGFSIDGQSFITTIGIPGILLGPTNG